jgi:hypothetical protein
MWFSFLGAAATRANTSQLLIRILLGCVRLWLWHGRPATQAYCRSYSPLPNRFNTVNPAFLASVMDNGFSLVGVLKVEITFRTGFLHSGQVFISGALMGRRNANRPPQMVQSPSQSSYS